ncbi:hypothetical protein AC578_2975 [Pseudocercospora eumusae]|uniref:Fungal STAND N-terminal Goodbye domain-containing protein n=1 Tax=Pseudocercospora eumusae TaxID=321146 RepID=A0A139HEH1_9PEZI|nr:hypothetical protein AC578_2975 [Pseudocercospora eumusae]
MGLNSKWYSSTTTEPERLFRTTNDLWADRERWASGLPSEAVGSARSKDSFYQSSKDDLQVRIVELDSEEDPDSDLAARVTDQLQITKIASAKLKAKRTSTTGRKITTGFQSFLYTFSQFLESFSGICEIVRAADQQYGGLAYGTLSLLLSVAAHKSQREEAIEEAMEELSFACPRLRILTGLNPSIRLQELIADVFGLIIIFARESTEYYLSRTLRFKESFVPSKVKGMTLTRIRKQLAQVREETEFLMLQEISKMRHTIEDMNRTLRSTQASVLAQGSSADGEFLADLRHTLGVKVGAPHMDLPEYTKLLAKAFNIRRAAIRVPYETTMEILMENQQFGEWIKTDQSSLMFAGGVNWHKHSCKDLNWLSQSSTLAINSLKERGQKVIWFLCQTDWTVPSRRRCTLQTVMSYLVYQLVCLHRDRIRIQHDNIRRIVVSDEWTNGDHEEELAKFADLFIGLLQEFGSDFALHIVIDRLDQCQWSDDDGFEGWSMRFVLDTFLEIMSKVPCRLKVLIVADASAAQQLSSYQTRDSRLLRDTHWTQKMR